MGEFIKPGLLRATIKTPYQNISIKEKVKKNDVNLSFLLARDMGRAYKIIYVLNIITDFQRLNPQIRLSPSRIDMFSLRNAILANVSLFDRKYIELTRFDTRKAEFEFKHDKWLDDGLKYTQPLTEFSRFSRTFNLKVRVPSMIFHDFTSIPFEKFVLRKFREYMEKKQTAAKWFKHLFPSEMRQQLRRSMATRMFEYSYDIQWNKITIILKPMYILGLMYAIGIATKKLTKGDLKSSYKEGLFAMQVKKGIKQFDRKKWEKYTRRHFI